MHSKKFEKIKEFYETVVNGERLWDIEKVRNAVAKSAITETEFEEITGESYE